MEDQLSLSGAKESQMAKELALKDGMISQLQKKSDEQADSIRELVAQLEAEKRAGARAAEEIVGLNKRIAELEGKDSAHLDERGMLNKAVKDLEVEKVKLEGRANELAETLQIAQVEGDKKAETVRELEGNQQQLAEELEKCHNHIDQQNKCTAPSSHIKLDITELKEENGYIPQLSTKLKECSKKIEQTTEEAERERQKGAKLALENSALQQQLTALKTLCSGESSPEVLRGRIEELSLEKSKLQELVRTAQAVETAFGRERADIANAINGVRGFVEKAFGDLKTADDTGTDDEKTCRDSKEVKLALDEIKKSIRTARSSLRKSWETLQKECQDAKKRSRDLRSAGEGALAESSKLKEQLCELQGAIKAKEDAGHGIEAECERVKEALEAERKRVQEADEVMKEVYDALAETKGKYQGVDCVTARVNLNPAVNFVQDRKAALTELASMVAEVANALEDEVKTLNAKIASLGEERRKFEEIHGETLTEAQHLELVYKQENQRMEDTLKLKQDQVLASGFSQSLVRHAGLEL